MLRAALCTSLLAGLLAACGNGASPDDSPPAARPGNGAASDARDVPPAAKSLPATSPPATTAPERNGAPTNARGAIPPEDPLAGTWWCLLPEQAWLSLRLGVTLPEEGNGRSGRWITFDWSASVDENTLQRRSKPVAVALEHEGELLSIEGPAPMLTEKGEPNGQRGTWRLELRLASLPGEPLRFTGRAFHDELTPPEGTPAEMVRDFRPWSQ